MALQLALSLLLVAAAVVYLAWQIVVFLRRQQSGCGGCGSDAPRQRALRGLPRAGSQAPGADAEGDE